MFEIPGKYTTAKVMIDNVDEATYAQITQFVNHPAFTNPIAIMPDTHAGKGSVIGFTMPLANNIIPNVVGVDIGCGMLSARIPNPKLSLEKIDDVIHGIIPLGNEIRAHGQWADMKTVFEWSNVSGQLIEFVKEHNRRFNTSYKPVTYDYSWFIDAIDRIQVNPARAQGGIGTLGGGNHFIEMGVDESGDYWITIHTGSRNFGKCVADYHQKKAVDNIKNNVNKIIEIGIEEIKKHVKNKNDIPGQIKKLRQDNFMSSGNKGLETLTGDDALAYYIDMIFAQHYASTNRRVILNDIMRSFGFKGEIDIDVIESVHNYIDFKDMIIRKGAISAHAGERMVIPFNMKEGLWIVEGKGNINWNYSAPHGAGRVLSRSQANKTLDLKEFKKVMKGVYSSSVCQSTLDESPMAYKPAKVIQEAIEPTIKIIDKVKPILNIKSK